MSDKNAQQNPARTAANAHSATLAAEVERLKAEAEAARNEAAKAKADADAAKAEARAAEEEKARAEEELQATLKNVDREVSRQEAAIKRQLQSQRKVRIVINSGKEPKDRCPVPVACNGREYLIVRDKPVDVPQGVLNVLDLAIEQVPTVMEEGGQSRTIFEPAQRFAYRVLGRVDPATGELEA